MQCSLTDVIGYMSRPSLMNQTTPFCSTGCFASPARYAEGRVWQGFHGTSWNVDMTNEISARVIMNNLNAPGMEDRSGVNINWRCLE